MFNLLEILIFVAGILVVVLHFRFTLMMDVTSDLIQRINLILSISAASLLFIIASMMWRNRKIQQSQMQQLESEMEQRFRLNAALNTEQNKLSTLLVNWPDPVFLLDIHANIMDANPAAAHVLGYAKPEPLLGKNNVEFAPSELAMKSWKQIKGFLRRANRLSIKKHSF
jgi:PAS domain-containing protein